LQTQSSLKQTRFTPSSYPLSALFGLLIVVYIVLILINDDIMTPTENVYTAGL